MHTGKKQIDWSWLGAAHKYATGKSHKWEDIERSIAEARGCNRESATRDTPPSPPASSTGDPSAVP